MQLDFDTVSPSQAYRLMIETIIPRPIAWVLSDNGNQTLNLAPFSFFTGVCGRPPLLLLSVGHKRDGSRKDTWVNIEERGHFVIHVAPVELLREVVGSSASLAHGTSEVTAQGLALTHDSGWSLPRIQGPKAALYCERYEIIELGDDPQALIIGRVHRMYVDDAVVEQQDGGTRIKADALQPLARLGGELYATLGQIMRQPRPR